MKDALMAAIALAARDDATAIAALEAATEANPWANGKCLPERYRRSQYQVADWKHHHLAAPPRGAHWGRNDDHQYVLATIHGGIISDVVDQDQYPDRHIWARHETLPAAYRNSAYVMDDWQDQQLRQPDRGHRWLHVNGQYLMVATATGLIRGLRQDGQ